MYTRSTFNQLEYQEFQPGDKVVLKNNQKIIYVFLSATDTKALCLNPNNEEIELHLIAIEKYRRPRVTFRSI